MGMTIKQLADQLGVSKTTISKAISALGLSNRLNRSGNKYIISEDQTEQIKMQIANSRPQTANDKSQTASDKSQTASDKSQTASDKSQTASEQTASDKSQTASDKSQTASDKSQTASDKSQLENQIALIELLQKQLALLNEQLSIKDGQIKAYQEQIRILTDSLHDATVALTAEQALHAGTIQRQLKEQINSKEEAALDHQEQPNHKQSIFSKLFGRKNGM